MSKAKLGQLTFDPLAVRRVVEHALAAPEHLPKPTGFDEKTGTITTEPDGPGVLLVHDQGVYLMSNGLPGDTIGRDLGHFAAYAEGCNPNADPEWYDTARMLVGGDDFGEHYPWAQPIKEALDQGAEKVVVKLSGKHAKIDFVFPKAKPNGKSKSIADGEIADGEAAEARASKSKKKKRRTLEDFAADIAAKNGTAAADTPAEEETAFQQNTPGPTPSDGYDDPAIPEFLDAAKNADARAAARAADDEKRRAEAAARKSVQPVESDVDRRKIKGKPGKSAQRTKARATPKGDRKRHDWAAAEEAAERGVMPPAPDFSADTHRAYRGRLEELKKADEKELVAFIKECEAKPKLWHSMTALFRYAKLRLKALRSKHKKAKAA